uniref:Uncharacterized protein n=1 Tax=Trichobilharzia regenti TaxID=157069 RepID=A0AA85JGP8_TRIRE|nr:unnamed protein product [Trichobilharzia regenti]
MNGDISRIPIQSLSAVVSLTDIIPELPLPTPLHSGSSAETLLYDPSHSLHFSHAELVGYLSEALGNVCTNNIDFKEGFASDIIDPNLLPEPLVSSLKKLPVFEQKRGFMDYLLRSHIIKLIPLLMHIKYSLVPGFISRPTTFF